MKINFNLIKEYIKSVFTSSDKAVYDCNYINSINNYSLTEVNTGKKYNNKPVYRKVFTFTGPTTADTDVVLVSNAVPNLDTILSFSGTYKATSSNYWEINSRYGDPYNLSIYVNPDRNEIRGMFGSSTATGGQGIIILEYTKTTD